MDCLDNTAPLFSRASFFRHMVHGSWLIVHSTEPRIKKLCYEQPAMNHRPKIGGYLSSGLFRLKISAAIMAPPIVEKR